MREECCVQQRNERRALAARNHIGRAEVRNDGRVDGGCDERGLAKLPGAGDAAAGILLRDALVIDGLAMTTDEVEDLSLGSGLHGVAILLAESPIEARKLSSRGVARVHAA